MSAQAVLDDWKAWTGEHLVSWNKFFGIELFASDVSCIEFVYNDGNGLPPPGAAAPRTYEGRLFYEGPGLIRRVLGLRSGRFRGWGRLLQSAWIGSLSPAPTTATATTLTVRDRGQFPTTQPFWIVVQDEFWNPASANREIMQVTGGTGTGPGSFTVARGKLGPPAVAHRGDPNDPGKMSWVGLLGAAGNTTSDPPKPMYYTPSSVEWVHLEISTDAAEAGTFTYYLSDAFGAPDAIESEKTVAPRDGGQWSVITGELNFDQPWWLTYRKTFAG